MIGLTEILIILLSLVAIGAYCLKRHYEYFKDKGLPYVPPVWILGNLYRMFLLMEAPDTTLTVLYNELKQHRFGGIFQFWRPYYYICDPGLIEKVLVKDFSHFEDHGFSVDLETNPLDENLFNLTGNKWRALRNKLSPTFTSGKLKWMFPQIEKCAENMAAYLKNKLSEEDLEIRDLSSRYGLDVIATCAFGLESDSVNEPDNEFRKLTNRFVRPPFWRILVMFLRFGLPDLFKALKMKLVEPHIEKFFFELTRDSLEQRAKSNFKRNDFIQLLLELKQKGSVSVDIKDKDEVEEYNVQEKIEFTDSLLTSQVFIFFMAGFEASASLMSYALYYMSKDSEFQTKLREELLAAEKRHGGFCYDSVKESSLLDNAVSEVLRMQSPGIMTFRQCTKPYNLDNKILLNKGDNLMIPTISIHYDPEYYPEPEKFKPERFDGGKPPLGIYMPFGEGPRVCIARRFAILQIKVGIAMMIRRFEILHSKKNQEPFVRKLGSMSMEPIGGIWVKLREIKQQ